MSSKPSDPAEIIKNIEKNRYLIPCKCKICNDSFADVVLGTHHVSTQHRKREKKNVIENLSWNIKADLKKWELLQELRVKRDMIISRLSDANAISQAKIPDVVEIQRKKADISGIMSALLTDLEKTKKESEEAEDEEEADLEEDIDERDFEDSEEEEESNDKEKEISSEADEELEEEQSKPGQPVKKRNLCELLERELEKFLNAIKRLTMSSEVEKSLSSKTKSKAYLDKYAGQLDYYLGVAKAVEVLKESAPDLEIII